MELNMHSAVINALVRGLRAGLVFCAVSALVACGGDGDPTLAPPPFGGTGTGGDDGGGGVDPGAPVAADLSLAVSAATLNNTGVETVTATATAVDANRNTVAGIPVTLRVDQEATVQVSGSETNDSGTVTGKIGSGQNRSNRVITVTAQSGGLTRTATVQVIGTRLTGTPVPAVVSPSSAAKIQYRVADAADNPMSGVDIVVTGADGVQTSAKTGVSGDYEYAYTAPSAAGNLNIRASAGGVENVQTVLVQGGPGAIPNVPSGSVRSSSVRANPSVVTVNTEQTSNNRAEIRALFLGDANAPIKNIRVRFDLDGDAASIGGSFTTGTSIVYSDANGVATTAYVPGSRFSPTDKVVVRACWDYADFPATGAGSCPNASTKTTLTVISDALSVAIGTDNKILEGESKLTYVKRYVVQVNDSSGLAKSDVLISPLLDLTFYRKGEWEPGGTTWVKTERAQCPNEDLNRNGVSETYSNGDVEDANLSYNSPAGAPALDPPKASANVSFESATRTNNLGQVILRLEYPKSYGSWVDFNLVVAASGVAGTEGRANYFGLLPVAAADVSDVTTAPPFQLSPFGLQASGTVFVQTPDGSASALLCTDKN